MVWLVIILFLISLLLFLLLTPVLIDLDSQTGNCEMKITGIVRVNLLLDEVLYLKVRVLVFNFRINLLERKQKERIIQDKKVRNRKPHNFKSMMRKSIAIVKSFHVHRFYLDVDSGNYLLNSWLFPAAHLIDPGHVHLNVNFNSRNEFAITLENNLLRLVRAMLS